MGLPVISRFWNLDRLSEFNIYVVSALPLPNCWSFQSFLIIIIIIRCSGMFRNVPGCSMFRLLSTTNIITAVIHISKYCNLFGGVERKRNPFCFHILFLCWNFCIDKQVTKEQFYDSISSHLDRTSLVNEGFVLWLLGKFFLHSSYICYVISFYRRHCEQYI